MTKMDNEEKTKLRVLRFLQNAPASSMAAGHKDSRLLSSDRRGTISVSRRVCDRLLRDGLAVCEAEGLIAISVEGKKYLKRALATTNPFLHQNADLNEMSLNPGAAPVLVDMSESPLSNLLRLKTRSGKSFLCRREFNAGEKLRADYTRGQLVPRIGMNWEQTPAGKKSCQGGMMELNETAIAARRRVNDALEAVGPELSGILIDVCCFLKALGIVESERGWPVRSAKIVLKTGLAALARHYEPVASRGDYPISQIFHWGTDGYRPALIGTADGR